MDLVASEAWCSSPDSSPASPKLSSDEEIKSYQEPLDSRQQESSEEEELEFYDAMQEHHHSENQDVIEKVTKSANLQLTSSICILDSFIRQFQIMTNSLTGAPPEQCKSSVTGTRKRKRIRTSDKNAPSRPPNAFVLFKRENRTRIEALARRIGINCAEMQLREWNNLDEDSREVYNNMYFKSMAKYRADRLEYEARQH